MIKNMSKAIVDMQATEQTSVRGYQLRGSASTATNTVSIISSFDETASTTHPYAIAGGAAPTVSLALDLATEVATHNGVKFTSYAFALDTPGTQGTGLVPCTELITIIFPASFGLADVGAKWKIDVNMTSAPTGVTLDPLTGFGSTDVSIHRSLVVPDEDHLIILRYLPQVTVAAALPADATLMVGGNMVIKLTQLVPPTPA
jgi:hypothetical protein